ncbi:MAG: DUF4157 domain-containing protein [Sediminibacterium sp.]|nr:DUF4157 domain-containing protein [Sediminibacterium sp.]
MKTNSKKAENESRTSIQSDGTKQSVSGTVFEDNRESTRQQSAIQKMANDSARIVSPLNTAEVPKPPQLQNNRNNSAPSIVQKQATVQKANGLPEGLQNGIEQLSGIGMEDVKVHYNSSKPAQFKAHAFARGNEIHLGAGQEKHLPHEAWHIVQQKQGRVKPTVQLKDNTNVNDDAGLEQEADVMGAKAMQLKSTGDGVESAKVVNNMSGTAQLRKRDAIEYLENVVRGYDNYINPGKLKRSRLQMEQDFLFNDRSLDIFKNFRNILNLDDRLEPIHTKMNNLETLYSSPYTLSNDVKNYVRQQLAYTIQRVLNSLNFLVGGNRRRFLNLWNTGYNQQHYAYITKPLVNEILAGSVKDPDVLKEKKEKDQSGLEKWFQTPLDKKKTTPSEKIVKMIKMGDVMGSELPEDYWVAMKQFFVHTANFKPVNHQGRDMQEKEGGGYFRSTDNIIKNYYRDELSKSIEREDEGATSGKTIRAVNSASFRELGKKGKLSSTHINRREFSIAKDPTMNAAMYPSSQGSHTGSLGVLTNSVKTLRQVVKLKNGRRRNKQTLVGKEIDELTGIVNPLLLQGATSGNYHDLLLTNRGEVVREVTEWLNAQKYMREIGLEAIQSAEHASIIFTKSGVSDKNEKEWRDTFMNAFNDAANKLKLATRISRRSSFGFIYPTASSVGGPVRIWPGLVPAPIIKSILKNTLILIRNAETKSGKQKELDPTINFKAGDVQLHVEALKTAVLYANTALKNAKTRANADRMYMWILTRLKRNLEKAKFLLNINVSDGTKSPRFYERHFQKSGLVIENLMEYSYLFTAFTKRKTEGNDEGYKNYAARSLFTSTKEKQDYQSGKKQMAVFYLDSGMQAIVAANLLSREQLTKKGPLTYHDINSYFEYSTVNESNLNLEKFDSKVDKAPDIISVDLNPVLTAKGQQIHEPENELEKYKESGTKQKTIPIIDVTNSTLSKAAKLDLGLKYENYIILESLSKHQQLGADKFTMGRLVAVGTEAFIKNADKIVKPIANDAGDELWLTYARQMDEVYYGALNESERLNYFVKQAGHYDEFMNIMGYVKEWSEYSQLFKQKDKQPEEDKIKEAMELVQRVFDVYVKRKKENSEPERLKLALESLPSSDRRGLTDRTKQTSASSSKQETPVSEYRVTNVTRTGISNAGNTCYISSGLNMLAFSPYGGFLRFQVQEDDSHAALRLIMNTIVGKIRAGVLVQKAEIKKLLGELDARGLLPPPSFNDVALGMNSQTAQHDPNEVFFRKILDYFKLKETGKYSLRSTYHTKMTGLNHQEHDLIPQDYSQPDHNGKITETNTGDIALELPIARRRSLTGILQSYFSVEQIQGVKYRSHDDKVKSGPALRNITLGNELPRVISITLQRWLEGEKDESEVDMPTTFVLNGWIYRLDNVVYHHGASPDSGHYTSSNRVAGTSNWQYRDDSLVGNDVDFQRRKNTGYIYTYTRAVENKGQDVRHDRLDIKDPGSAMAEIGGLKLFRLKNDSVFYDFQQPGKKTQLKAGTKLIPSFGSMHQEFVIVFIELSSGVLQKGYVKLSDVEPDR